MLSGINAYPATQARASASVSALPMTGLPSLASLDVRVAVSSYFDKIVSSVSGMKVLLLDEECKRVVSMVYSQSQNLEKSVFLVAPLVTTARGAAEAKRTGKTFARRERMPHLKGIVLCRPTRANIEAIREELNDPLYGEYHLFFTNALATDGIRDLAEADKHAVVKEVQEYYADYLAVNKDLFDFDLEGSLKLSRSHTRWSREETEGLFKRSVKGMLAVLLSLRQRPTIRYSGSSELAWHFAKDLKNEMDKERALFDFGAAGGGHRGETLLLILDRRDDPVTPLLTQWTYQAMVHELIGLKYNICSLPQNVDVELQKVVLSQSNDEFFSNNMFKNYGALAENAKRMLDLYKDRFDATRQIKSVEDMTNFIESFPDFKKLANNATKHVAVVGELARLIDQFHLMDLSALEQDLACSSDHSSHLERVKLKIQDPAIQPADKLRLVLLYALRYETFGGNRVGELKQLLRQHDVVHADVALVDQILTYGGAARRTGDLFGSGGSTDIFSKTIQMGLKVVQGSSIVDNIYTQHKPLLARTLEEVRSGKLPESKYPSLSGASWAAPPPTSGGGGGFSFQPNSQAGSAAPPPTDVIVFILGGSTFEEAALVAGINQQTEAKLATAMASAPTGSIPPGNAGFRVLLGGTSVQNSRSFLRELGMLAGTSHPGGQDVATTLV